jgi:hypothetical protein
MCNDCRLASEKLHHGFSDCPGCRARAVARDPRFAEARKAGRMTPEYRRMLEQAKVTHEDVKAAAAVDKVRAKP